MGAIKLPDELQRVIDVQVAAGRAVDPVAFLEEAVMRLVDEASAEEDAVRNATEAGLSDVEAGRYTVVAKAEDERLLLARLMEKVQQHIGPDK